MEGTSSNTHFGFGETMLATSGLANVTNAFEPWDTDAWLDPLRHPLREYDPDLKGEPWRGDAHR